MRIIRNLGFRLSALVLFSILSVLSRGAQADTTASVDGQANTTAASTTGVSELPEVTVKAKGVDQAAAFDQMHDSFNKLNILSQDQINQTPAKSVAQAAEQLPGVGTSHDTSEARYISIRGTDPDFDIVTFNQTILPSYDRAARSVDLDAIPAGLFGEMQVIKTILPDMDAQGVGGQMNLVPKYAKDYPGGILELKAEGELFPERNQPGGLGLATWADTIGLGGNSNLGLLITAGYQYSKFGIDDLENDWTDPASSPLSPRSISDYQLRYYDYERDRAGIGTNITLDMDKDNKLYVNLLYAGYDEYRDPVWHTEYRNLDAVAGAGVVNADGSITIPDAAAAGVQVRKTMAYELTEFRNLAAGLGGENNLGGFILDYKASLSYADQNVPWNYNYNFRTPGGAVTGALTYNNTANNGNSPVLNFSGLGGTDSNSGNFLLHNGASNGTSDYNIVQYGGKADGKFDIPLGGDDKSTVKFGAAMRMEYSTSTGKSYSAAANAPLAMTAVLGPTSTAFYPGNLYNMGPLPGLTETTNLLNNTNSYVGPYTQTDPIGDKGGDYNNWEDVYAGYAMYTVKSGPMEVMAGARLEVTHIQYNWFLANQIDPTTGDPTGPELPAVIDETGTIDYNNILPSLGFKYVFNPDLTTRMNFSQTIARPTQSQYIPAFSLGQSLSAQANNSNVAFTFGNPGLQPMISNNIDFSFELYPQKAAILACDFFLKDLRNYFEQNYSRVDGAGGVGSGGVTDSLNYINIPTANIYGAEFQYQQQYTSLPGILGGLGFRGSLSVMGSQGELAQGIYGEIPFQSDLLFETAITYNQGGFSFDVAGNFTGKNLMVVGDPNANNSPNIYRDDFFQINAKAQYAFTKDFKIYADGNNLNNANLRYYWGAPNYPIQNEYYGPSFDGGVVVDF